MNSDASGSLENVAVVCDEDDPDCSEPPICDCCEQEDGTPEGCEIITVVGPSIKIDKTDGANSNDQDGITGNDNQKVDKGETAVFKIRVTNDGDESLKDIVLTDAQAENCAGTVTLPATYPNTWTSFTVGGTGDTTDVVLEPGEWFEYTCEKSNTQNDYINSATVTGVGVDSGTSVNDSDTSPVDVDGDDG